jgi:molybdenum cofactor cytidylyltransferase
LNPSSPNKNTLYDSQSMVSGIILAAGESRRMGQPKLLLPWGKTTILESVVDNYLRSKIFELIVVVGASRNQIKEVLTSKPVIIVENLSYKEGMSSSIRQGVKAASKQAEGYLIGLGDQPLITTDIINHLITSFLKERMGIAICACQQKRGHPVIFNRKFRPALCALKGDIGGKVIIEQNPDEVKYIEVGSKAIFADIDTLEDYQKFQSPEVKTTKNDL